MKQIALLLALAVLLCGCVKTPPPADTAPPQTTEPTETTAPADLAVTIEEIAAMAGLSTSPNWLALSLGCIYENPKDVDLYFMFYLGVDHPGSWDDISAESRQSLIDQGFLTDMDLQIMPVKKLEAALLETFGIGLDGVTIPDSWGYIEQENAYCSNHNDAYFPGVPIITDVYDDGKIIHIYYTIEDFWDYRSEVILDTANLVLGLEWQEDGTCRAVYNVPAF